MRRKIFGCLGLIFALLICSTSAGQTDSQNEKKLLLVTAQRLSKAKSTKGKPYEGLERLRAFVRQAFKSLGYETEFQSLPGDRALNLVNSGNADGDYARAGNLKEIDPKHTGNLVRVDEAMTTFDYYAYGKSGPPKKIQSWQDLKGLSIVMINGQITLKHLLNRNRIPFQYDRVSSFQKAFDMIHAGRGDIVICTGSVGDRILKEKPYSTYGLAKVSDSLHHDGVFIYLNKRHQGLAKGLADSIKKIKSKMKPLQ